MIGKVPLGILSLRFSNDAKDYISAAETLIRESQVKLPTYFLLSHALELSLKAYLAAHGVTEDQLRKKPLRHDIQHLFDKAVGLGLSVAHKDAPLLAHAISEFHDAHLFRYPVVNKDGYLIVIGSLVNANEVLEVVREIWARRSRSNQGPFPSGPGRPVFS